MLRVTTAEDAAGVSFKLEGKLAGSSVDVLEQCWGQAQAENPQKAVTVDLTAVTYIDERASELLGRMYDAGAELHAKTCWAKGVVDDIKSIFGGPAKPRR